MNKLIATILAAAVATISVPAETRAADLEEITVAYFTEWPTANQVAQVEKWYDDELGVKVNWRIFGAGTEMADAMKAGEVQIAYSMGVVPFVVAVSEGNPIKTVGVALTYAENDNCVVHNKAAIDKANAHELEGKKVAVPLRTVTHYKLLRTLVHLGVDTSKLDLVDMVSADAEKALAAGEVTMACGWGGYLLRMTKHGRVLMSAMEQERLGIRVFDVIAVTSDFAAQHPDLVTKFLAVTEKATIHYEDDPEAATPVIAKAAGLGLIESNIVLSRFRFPRRNAQVSDFWLGGGVQAFTKEVADFLAAQNEIPKALDDYGPTIDASFYEKVQ